MYGGVDSRRRHLFQDKKMCDQTFAAGSAREIE